jgi:hypothetical protein
MQPSSKQRFETTLIMLGFLWALQYNALVSLATLQWGLVVHPGSMQWVDLTSTMSGFLWSVQYKALVSPATL